MVHVSDANRAVAKLMAHAFGGNPRVNTYHDASRRSSVAIISSADRPSPGVASYGTVGLSDFPLRGSNVTPPLGVEIVGACDKEQEAFPNVLATSAFCVMNSNWDCMPGAIFSAVVAAHVPETTVPHMLLVSPPFLWEDVLRSRQIEHKTVAWLLAVPISTTERDYARERGSDMLETLFEREQIDIFDLMRPSVV